MEIGLISTLLPLRACPRFELGVLLSVVVFIAGSPLYTKTAPQGNIMVKVCKCIGVSVSWLQRDQGLNCPSHHAQLSV